MERSGILTLLCRGTTWAKARRARPFAPYQFWASYWCMSLCPPFFSLSPPHPSHLMNLVRYYCFDHHRSHCAITRHIKEATFGIRGGASVGGFFCRSVIWLVCFRCHCIPFYSSIPSFFSPLLYHPSSLSSLPHSCFFIYNTNIFGYKLYIMLRETANKSTYLAHVMRQLLFLVILTTASFALKGLFIYTISTSARDAWVCVPLCPLLLLSSSPPLLLSSSFPLTSPPFLPSF